MNWISWWHQWLIMSIGKCAAESWIKILNPVIRMFFHEQRFSRDAFICRCKCLYFKCLLWRILTNIGCYEAGCIYVVFFWVLSQYSPVIGFWYCTGILCCQLKCVFASLPTVWAVSHGPQGLRCLFPFGHLLHPWDLHDEYLKVLKLCVLVQWHYFIWQLSFVTSCHLCTLCVCVVGCPCWGFLFFPSICPDKCQYSISN